MLKEWYDIDETLELLSEKLGMAFTKEKLFQAIETRDIIPSIKIYEKRYGVRGKLVPSDDSKVMLSCMSPELYLRNHIACGGTCKTAFLDNELEEELKKRIKKYLTMDPDKYDEADRSIYRSSIESMIDALELYSQLPPFKEQLAPVFRREDINHLLDQAKTESNTYLGPDFQGQLIHLPGQQNRTALIEYQDELIPQQLPFGIYEIPPLENNLPEIRKELLQQPCLIEPKAFWLINAETGSFYLLVDRAEQLAYVTDNGKIVVPHRLSCSIIDESSSYSSLGVQGSEIAEFINGCFELSEQMKAQLTEKTQMNNDDEAAEHDNNPSFKSPSRVTTSANSTQSLADEKREKDERLNPWKAQIRNIIEDLIEKNGEVPSVKIVISEIEKQVEEDPVHFKKQDAKVTSTQAARAMERGHTDRLFEYVIHGEAKTIRTWKYNIEKELKQFSTESTESTEKRPINL